ncbi:hypothetical protein BJ742DRAFT_412837 [Cladochytrium replicatum]|nr:hypothetical protein BJ742DRAFT_412837 [Cladochytrium replicatum]
MIGDPFDDSCSSRVAAPHLKQGQSNKEPYEKENHDPGTPTGPNLTPQKRKMPEEQAVYLESGNKRRKLNVNHDQGFKGFAVAPTPPEGSASRDGTPITLRSLTICDLQAANLPTPESTRKVFGRAGRDQEKDASSVTLLHSTSFSEYGKLASRQLRRASWEKTRERLVANMGANLDECVRDELEDELDQLACMEDRESVRILDPEWVNKNAYGNSCSRWFLVNWMASMSCEQLLQRTTFHIAVELMDTVGSAAAQKGVTIAQDDLQMLAASCLTWAHAIEEYFPPALSEYVLWALVDGNTDNEAAQEECRKLGRMITNMIQLLGHQFTVANPTAYEHLLLIFRRHLQTYRHDENGVHDKHLPPAFPEPMFSTSADFLDFATADNVSLEYPRAVLAAAVYDLVSKQISSPNSDEVFEFRTGYSRQDIDMCTEWLERIWTTFEKYYQCASGLPQCRQPHLAVESSTMMDIWQEYTQGRTLL